MLFAGSSETRAEKEDTYSSNRGMKRKAVDQGLKCALLCHDCVSHELTKAFVVSDSVP